MKYLPLDRHWLIQGCEIEETDLELESSTLLLEEAVEHFFSPLNA